MKLLALPAFADNYIWMLHDGQQALVVDPGDASVVASALQQHQLTLSAILVTHHHPDHTAGLPALREHLVGEVYGPHNPAIQGITQRVKEGDRFRVLGLDIEVWEVPGHTLDHLAFVVQPSPELPCPGALVWCGDTLFSAGCGRLFEGTARQLHDSLQRLGRLPGDTCLCPTHEYTLANLRFALDAEPGNPDTAQHLLACEHLRQHHLPTLPTTVAQELQINPFLRTTQPGVVAQALSRHASPDTSSVSVFAALRQWKNHHPA